MTKPKRAVQFYIEIDGNTREDIGFAISELERRFHNGDIAASEGPGLSASPSVSWVYHYVENTYPTKDEYFKALDVWLEEKRDAHGIGETKSDRPHTQGFERGRND